VSGAPAELGERLTGVVALDSLMPGKELDSGPDEVAKLDDGGPLYSLMPSLFLPLVAP